MTPEPNIPLCRAEFLQDISIELGRRFAARHPFRSFTAEVDTCQHDGESLESLAVWATTYYGTAVNLTLWEDGTVWVSVTLWSAENTEEYKVGFYPCCDGFTPERIAEAFRDTVSVSTRLCYGESPLLTLRQIWKHTGEVQTTGILISETNRTPQPE
jgi:hypothetical protein